MSLQPYFGVGVVGGVEGFVEVGFAEAVDVDDSHSVRFQELGVLLQCSRIHSHEYIGQVAGGVNSMAYTYLEARHTAQCALWCADFSRIVGKSGDLVAHLCRYIREDVTGKLHSITGVARESYYHFFKCYNIRFF